MMAVLSSFINAAATVLQREAAALHWSPLVMAIAVVLAALVGAKLAGRVLGMVLGGALVVGAVLVGGGEVVGRGWHRGPGPRHAEIEALREAGERARGATLYVTLEPCRHFGRTPPCTAALIAAGVSRVVAAIEDPNPAEQGKGIAELRAAGLDVSVGAGRENAEAMNLPYFTWRRLGRPLVTAKWAAAV